MKAPLQYTAKIKCKACLKEAASLAVSRSSSQLSQARASPELTVHPPPSFCSPSPNTRVHATVMDDTAFFHACTLLHEYCELGGRLPPVVTT